MDTEGIDHHALDAEHITSFFCCIIGQEQHQDTTCMHVPREDCNKWKERLTSCATTSNNRQRKERQNIKHMENAKAEATVTQRGTNTHRSRSSVPPEKGKKRDGNSKKPRYSDSDPNTGGKTKMKKRMEQQKKISEQVGPKQKQRNVQI
jgi:hypothetical protein